MTSLLPHLPTRHQDATSVPALAQATGLPERAVRAEIARLVNEERLPIVSLPTPHGIYLATTPEDLDPVIADLRSRAGSMLRRCRSLRIARESLAWSPTLFPND